MKHLKTAALLLAPPLLMGGFALYLGRSSGQKAATIVRGPFFVQIASIEQTPVTPLDVFGGYNRKFEIVFDASGRKPAWWGKKIRSWTATEAQTWKFFLERDGKTTPYVPSKTQIWTSNWDEKSKRYSNKLLLNCDDVPTHSALKVRGATPLGENPTKHTLPLPFELTLKKAGEPGAKPVVSRDSGLVVRKITIKRVGISDRVAEILVFNPNVDYASGWTDGGDFLDGNWREFKHLETANNAWKGYWVPLQHSFGGGNLPDIGGLSEKLDRQSKNVRQYDFSWKVPDMREEPRRDVIAVAHVSNGNRWPLEIAFYAKKNGQQALGVVPALTRPR